MFRGSNDFFSCVCLWPFVGITKSTEYKVNNNCKGWLKTNYKWHIFNSFYCFISCHVFEYTTDLGCLFVWLSVGTTTTYMHKVTAPQSQLRWSGPGHQSAGHRQWPHSSCPSWPPHSHHCSLGYSAKQIFLLVLYVIIWKPCIKKLGCQIVMTVS